MSINVLKQELQQKEFKDCFIAGACILFLKSLLKRRYEDKLNDPLYDKHLYTCMFYISHVTYPKLKSYVDVITKKTNYVILFGEELAKGWNNCFNGSEVMRLRRYFTFLQSYDAKISLFDKVETDMLTFVKNHVMKKYCINDSANFLNSKFEKWLYHVCSKTLNDYTMLTMVSTMCDVYMHIFGDFLSLYYMNKTKSAENLGLNLFVELHVESIHMLNKQHQKLHSLQHDELFIYLSNLSYFGQCMVADYLIVANNMSRESVDYATICLGRLMRIFETFDNLSDDVDKKDHDIILTLMMYYVGFDSVTDQDVNAVVFAICKLHKTSSDFDIKILRNNYSVDLKNTAEVYIINGIKRVLKSLKKEIDEHHVSVDKLLCVYVHSYNSLIKLCCKFKAVDIDAYFDKYLNDHVNSREKQTYDFSKDMVFMAIGLVYMRCLDNTGDQKINKLVYEICNYFKTGETYKIETLQKEIVAILDADRFNEISIKFDDLIYSMVCQTDIALTYDETDESIKNFANTLTPDDYLKMVRAIQIGKFMYRPFVDLKIIADDASDEANNYARVVQRCSYDFDIINTFADINQDDNDAFVDLEKYYKFSLIFCWEYDLTEIDKLLKLYDVESKKDFEEIAETTSGVKDIELFMTRDDEGHENSEINRHSTYIKIMMKMITNTNMLNSPEFIVVENRSEGWHEKRVHVSLQQYTNNTAYEYNAVVEYTGFFDKYFSCKYFNEFKLRNTISIAQLKTYDSEVNNKYLKKSACVHLIQCMFSVYAVKYDASTEIQDKQRDIFAYLDANYKESSFINKVDMNNVVFNNLVYFHSRFDCDCWKDVKTCKDVFKSMSLKWEYVDADVSKKRTPKKEKTELDATEKKKRDKAAAKEMTTIEEAKNTAEDAKTNDDSTVTTTTATVVPPPGDSGTADAAGTAVAQANAAVASAPVSTPAATIRRTVQRRGPREATTADNSTNPCIKDPCVEYMLELRDEYNALLNQVNELKNAVRMMQSQKQNRMNKVRRRTNNFYRHIQDRFRTDKMDDFSHNVNVFYGKFMSEFNDVFLRFKEKFMYSVDIKVNEVARNISNILDNKNKERAYDYDMQMNTNTDDISMAHVCVLPQTGPGIARLVPDAKRNGVAFCFYGGHLIRNMYSFNKPMIQVYVCEQHKSFLHTLDSFRVESIDYTSDIYNLYLYTLNSELV